MPVNTHESEIDGMEESANKSFEYFIGSIPELMGCSQRVRMGFFKQNIDVELDNSSPYASLEKIRQFVGQNIRLNESDIVVGIGPDRWQGRALGFVNPLISNTGYITNESEIIAAHEIGHLFGLSDEYCIETNWVNKRLLWDGCNNEPNLISAQCGCDCSEEAISYSNDISESCCWRDEKNDVLNIFGKEMDVYEKKKECTAFYGKDATGIICSHGNVNRFGGRSLMSYMSAPGPRYHDEPSLEYLSKNDKLRCD